MLVAAAIALYHRPLAPPPRHTGTLGAAYAHYPRVPHYVPTTAIAAAAVLLAMRGVFGEVLPGSLCQNPIPTN